MRTGIINSAGKNGSSRYFFTIIPVMAHSGMRVIQLKLIKFNMEIYLSIQKENGLGFGHN